MLTQISQEIKQLLTSFPEEDEILFNNKRIKINKNNFQPLPSKTSNQTLAFIDGGQAEILSAGNFCLSFIRVFALVFKNNKKIDSCKNEFYLLTYAQEKDDSLFYCSKIFPLKEKLFPEEDLLFDSYDPTLKIGLERAPLSKIANIARRFAELSFASKLQADFIILDGTLQPTFKNEEKYLKKLPSNVSALAKTSSLFTASGNNPNLFLNRFSPLSCWSYHLENQAYFVKLHPLAKHVFRFEGNPQILPYLLENSQDPLFLGYPYGLILADKFARVSNQEKNSLQTQFLLKSENKEILNYLTATNAHEILDSLG